MEDRFKFRVFLKYNQIMCDIDSYCFLQGLNKCVFHFTNGGQKTLKNDDFILIQCTGLKDKNGTLIYEGDIVKITREDWRKDLYSLVYAVCWDRTQWQLGLLKWQRPKAQANRRSDRTFPFKNIVSFDDYTPKKFFAQCEIIGNVYENEELLYNETQF